MRNSVPFSVAAAALVALAACSSPSAKPAMSDDLQQDLAKVGGGDVQLAGAPMPRLQVVSAVERNQRETPAPRAPRVTRAPSATRGARAVVRSVKHTTSAPQTPAPKPDVAPAEAPRAMPAPEPTRAQARPQEAPMPSPQREPRGGWKTEAEVFRNSPFPINP